MRWHMREHRINRILWAMRLRDLRDRAWRWLAWHLPSGLVYWCGIRVVANATQGEHSTQEVPQLTAMAALKRWPST